MTDISRDEVVKRLQETSFVFPGPKIQLHFGIMSGPSITAPAPFEGHVTIQAHTRKLNAKTADDIYEHFVDEINRDLVLLEKSRIKDNINVRNYGIYLYRFFPGMVRYGKVTNNG